MRIRRGLLPVVCLLLLGAPYAPRATASIGEGVGRNPDLLLAELHPDFRSFIGAVRVISTQAARVSPRDLYSGLVRSGGMDPRLPEDLPESGKGARNDLILFPATLDPLRSPGWLPLILDHEYFHARHLAQGWRTPVVDFGDARANHSYYETVAWGYVLERAWEGLYGALASSDLREVEATYLRHLGAFRNMILDRQPSAWSHYSRFLLDPSDPASGGALREARPRTYEPAHTTP